MAAGIGRRLGGGTALRHAVPCLLGHDLAMLLEDVVKLHIQLCPYKPKNNYFVDAKNYPSTIVVTVALLTSFGANSGRTSGGEREKDTNKPDAIVSIHLADDTGDNLDDNESVESFESSDSNDGRTNSDDDSNKDKSAPTSEKEDDITGGGVVTTDNNNNNDDLLQGECGISLSQFLCQNLFWCLLLLFEL